MQMSLHWQVIICILQCIYENCAVDITDNFVPPPGIPMNYCAMHRGTGNHAV